MEFKEQIEKLEEELRQKKAELSELRTKVPPSEVKDYTFTGRNAEKRNLSEMFGDHDQLIVIHNMGKKCNYCTMWADGFTGIAPYLESRAGFVLISPDDVATMTEFANSRGWNYKVYSSAENSFKEDLGFKDEKYVIPGVSVFKKDENGKIFHVASSVFGPGDNFCIGWDFFDLLPDKNEIWNPGSVNKK